jgi:hypothetical protein
VLAKILYDDRVSRQFDAREPEDADTIVSSMLPITRSIPTDYLYPCYVLAIETRPAGNTFPISGIEIIQAWKAMQGSVEMESINASRLLPENASAACLRCGKDGREIMLDGSIGGPCDHRPFSEEEKLEAERLRADFLNRARAEAQEKYQARLKKEREAKEEKPVFKVVNLECDCCRRRFPSDGIGFVDGDTCGTMLPDERLCEGKMRERKKITSPV